MRRLALAAATPHSLRARILERVAPLDAEDVHLTQGHGRVLAEDVHAERDVPPFANSAMDGYAVRAVDVRGASRSQPVRLSLLGEVRAGAAPPTGIRPNTALRIMTGAMVPEGSDAVVRVEDTAENAGSVEVRVAVETGTSLRAAGSDLRRGDLVAAAGRVITPGLIGVLASAGRASVRCVRRPRVLLLTTGDELREPGESLGPGQIMNTNRYTLLAAIEDAGAVAIDAGRYGADGNNRIGLRSPELGSAAALANAASQFFSERSKRRDGRYFIRQSRRLCRQCARQCEPLVVPAWSAGD